jgi:hypothetical protein
MLEKAIVPERIAFLGHPDGREGLQTFSEKQQRKFGAW